MTFPPPEASQAWAYFLDLDGSLIELADSPEGIHVDPPLRELLARVHEATGGALAVVSGRNLSDLDRWLELPQLSMAGQHGLERRTAKGGMVSRAEAPSALAQFRHALKEVVSQQMGLLLEDKGLTLALHYRQAPHLESHVMSLMSRLVAPYTDTLQIQRGKCVMEVKPAGTDKGSAVEAFMAEPPFHGRVPVFIGDDVTDEHAFAVVNRLGGLSIKVGPGSTCAAWRLPDVSAVRLWLSTILHAELEASLG